MLWWLPHSNKVQVSRHTLWSRSQRFSGEELLIWRQITPPHSRRCGPELLPTGSEPGAGRLPLPPGASYPQAFGAPVSRRSPHSVPGAPVSRRSPRSVPGAPVSRRSPRSVPGAAVSRRSPHSVPGAPVSRRSPHSVPHRYFQIANSHMVCACARVCVCVRVCVCIFRYGMLWSEWYPLPNLSIKGPTCYVIVFGDGAFKEVIKAKEAMSAWP